MPEAEAGEADPIPDDALEFNPNTTDVNKVFVEQPPSPGFRAATGTFNALRLEAEEDAAARAHEQSARELPAEPGDEDSQVDVELDRELLESMARTYPHGLPAQPDPTSAPASVDTLAPAAASSSSTSVPGESAAAGTRSPTSEVRVLPTSETRPLPASNAGSAAAATPIAARAKARVDVARASLESNLAIRSALLGRKRAPIAPAAEHGAPALHRPTVMWAAGSALLAILLILQVIHHYRDDLAATAALNGPLTSLYSALGVPLVPRWNLGAYEVRQLGASTAAEAPGRITVRASVKNDAHQPQPLPLLRVTLQDRFGNRIAARDVPPQSYLPRAVPASALLSAGQRVDAEMAFVDPGANAVGFEIDACLPAPEGGITCANDTSR